MSSGVSELQKKYEALKNILQRYDCVAVAFSGGVDSAFLLRTAQSVLGNRVTAVTARCGVFPEREQKEANDFCDALGIRQEMVDLSEGASYFRENPVNRCYFCKYDMMQRIRAIAEEKGLGCVLEGSNIDDLGDYRPGRKAVEELEIVSPLLEAGLWKAEIRQLSKELGLSTWDKPSMACLASRVPYGETITAEKLRMIDRGEDILHAFGFHQVRVRMHGTLARIELLPEDIPALLSREMWENIHRQLCSLGFSYVTLDLGGYRTGSLNDALKEEGDPVDDGAVFQDSAAFR